MSAPTSTPRVDALLLDLLNSRTLAGRAPADFATVLTLFGAFLLSVSFEVEHTKGFSSTAHPVRSYYIITESLLYFY
jgi:hypothetical protein